MEQEIAELMREAEVVDSQEDGKYGKGKRGSDLPEELQRREDRLEKIRQARMELEAETAAVAARERLEQAAEAQAAAREAAGEAASEEEQQNRVAKAEKARHKAEAATELTMEKAALAGLEPPDGLRRFLMRGLEKVTGEWTLWSTTHNILKLFRFQKTQPAMATG